MMKWFTGMSEKNRLTIACTLLSLAAAVLALFIFAWWSVSVTRSNDNRKAEQDQYKVETIQTCQESEDPEVCLALAMED